MSLIHVSRRSPREGHGHPLQYSYLESPTERGAWWATVHGVAKSQTQLKQLSTHACTYKDIAIIPHITSVDSWGSIYYLKFLVLEFCKNNNNNNNNKNLCNLFKDLFSHPFENRIKKFRIHKYLYSSFRECTVLSFREVALNKMDLFTALIKSTKHAISRWCNKFYYTFSILLGSQGVALIPE